MIVQGRTMRSGWPIGLLMMLCACQTGVAPDGGRLPEQTARRQTHSSTTPVGGIVPIQQEDLRAGDILFSAEDDISSVGVRLFSQAAVSHAFIYLGDGMAAEAVRSGVHIAPVQTILAHSNLMAAYRHPDLTPADAVKIKRFAHDLAGQGYYFLGCGPTYAVSTQPKTV